MKVAMASVANIAGISTYAIRMPLRIPISTAKPNPSAKARSRPYAVVYFIEHPADRNRPSW